MPVDARLLPPDVARAAAQGREAIGVLLNTPPDISHPAQRFRPSLTGLSRAANSVEPLPNHVSDDPSFKTLYTAFDQRQDAPTAHGITQRLRSKFGIATGEGMVGTRELAESISALTISSNTRLLDLGSGSAEPSRWIAQATGCSLVAVDVSVDRLNRIPRTARLAGACADLNNCIPFTDSAFDACVHYDSIVHIADRDRYLTELRRVAQPASIIAITSATNEPLTELEHLGLGDVAGTIWRLSTPELEAVLERNGWMVTTIRSRRPELIGYHIARRDALREHEQQLLGELPRDSFDRLVARAATVAALLQAERLDMIFLVAVRQG